MTVPKLAFVVATKDRPAELQRMWDSLVAQSRVPDEVVIVDASAHPAPPSGGGAGRPVLRFLLVFFQIVPHLTEVRRRILFMEGHVGEGGKI